MMLNNKSVRSREKIGRKTHERKNQVLTYMAAKLEDDRVYSSAVYANADKVFGDKKGTAKLRCASWLHLGHRSE